MGGLQAGQKAFQHPLHAAELFAELFHPFPAAQRRGIEHFDFDPEHAPGFIVDL